MRRFAPRAGLLILGTVILLSFQAELRPKIWGTGQRIMNPVTRAIGRAGEEIGGRVSSLLHVTALSKRVRELAQEVARLEGQRATLESTNQENADLRSALALLPRDRLTLVVADVVGPAADGVSAALRINRGSADGIFEGAAVIVADGVAVGKVSSVSKRSATVDLLTSGRVKLTARALGTNASGIVRGLRGLDVVLENVPRTDELRPQDRLVTTGTDGIFPPHLFVGTIKAVRSGENAVYQEASVQLPLDLHRLRIIAVITRS